jgi:hypothetical protein
MVPRSRKDGAHALPPPLKDHPQRRRRRTEKGRALEGAAKFREGKCLAKRGALAITLEAPGGRLLLKCAAKRLVPAARPGDVGDRDATRRAEPGTLGRARR